MKVALVIFNYDAELREPQEYYRHLQEHLLNGIDPSSWGIDRLSVVCRAELNADAHFKNINIYLRKDELPAVLRWHQRPDRLFGLLKELNPDVIHAFSLGLPLHYRWLRNLLGPGVCLVAHHTGERHWIQMRLWLQQFGLRVVDGFVFGQKEDARDWLKAALILPAQTVISLENGHSAMRRELIIPEMYRELSPGSSL